MKTTTVFLLLLTLGLLSNCMQNKPTDDPEMLKTVLRDYFDGLKNRDIKKLNEVTTTDFVSFEDGKVWTNDSLINSISQFKSFQGEWKFDNLKVNVDHSSGDITYFDHGDFILNDTIKMSFDWIESATFRKIDGKWKLNFLHSTVKKK
jgi:hypothetical protein